jgi:predicted PurR-regulated permease PerM
MAVDGGPENLTSQKRLLDVLIRAGLIAVLVIICYRVFHPFMDLLLWAMILAVTLYPLQRRWRRRYGMKEGRTATAIVILAIVILLVPVYLVGTSIAGSVEHALSTVRSGSLVIPPPPAFVADWPLVGKPLHQNWTQGASDMSVLTQKFSPQIKAMALAGLGKIAGFTVGLLLFIFALILAGIFLAYGESGHRSAVRAFARAFGPGRGEHIAELCTATIRAVAQGVIGIAFIQMLLVGIGFAVMGVPAAGLLSIVVLLLGIMQIPATVITVPVIAFVLATKGVSGATILFSVYVFVAGLVDNVLKPLLLGRGVDVPMPVVLIGALGGMVTSGILGLFLGPVVLAIGYELFWQWVDNAPPDVEPAGSEKVVADQLAADRARAAAP